MPGRERETPTRGARPPRCFLQANRERLGNQLRLKQVRRDMCDARLVQRAPDRVARKGGTHLEWSASQHRSGLERRLQFRVTGKSAAGTSVNRMSAECGGSAERRDAKRAPRGKSPEVRHRSCEQTAGALRARAR